MPESVLIPDDPGVSDGTDFTLREGAPSCWLTVDGISVYVRRFPGHGVRVELYAKGAAGEDEIASCEAFAEVDAG